MTKEERKLEEKKLKYYEKLGALKFQKVVLKVEEIKFKTLKKFFPNFIVYFDKYCDIKKKFLLKKAKSKSEKKSIIQSVKITKLAMRKELNTEKINYY